MGRRWFNKSLMPDRIIESSLKYSVNLPFYSKTKYGVINRWQDPNQVKSVLACTQSLADIKLTANYSPQSTIRWADLDPVEHRYLVVGKHDEGLSLYDSSKAWITRKFSHLGTFRSDDQGNNSGQVTCVQWYPFDAGLIISSSICDKTIKIWDPNPLALVDEFKVSSLVAHHDLSPVASGHSLIATALDSGEVALCDLRTGSSTHHLRYHHRCTFVQWSKLDQNILASGGINNVICIWDVRSSKACLKKFNEDHIDNAKICSLSYTFDGLWMVSLSSNSKSPLNIWNTKTYEKKNIKINIPFKFPSRAFRIDVTRNNYPDHLYIPTVSEILVFNLTTGDLNNILRSHDFGLCGVNYNPISSDVYSFGGKKSFMVFSPRFVMKRNKEERENEEIVRRNNNLEIIERITRQDIQLDVYDDVWSSGSEEDG